jgi:hypothetical protein
MDDLAFRNTILKHMATEGTITKILGAMEVELAYSGTHPTSLLRKFLVDAFIARLNRNIFDGLRDQYTPAFLGDLAMTALRTVPTTTPDKFKERSAKYQEKGQDV